MFDGEAILIAGPTASGKSAIAVEVARAVGGIIINADSMQVYRDLRVLTARPAADEMAGIRHELYGFLGPCDAYSVARYLADVAVHLEAARSNGAVPVIVGGTGLYFKGLLEGLSPVPAIDPAVRERWRELGEREGAGVLHQALKARDPVMAGRLMATDVQRLVRALEVIESTGRSLSHWQQQPGTPVLDGSRCRKIVVTRDREELYERCERRFDQMVKSGGLFEVSRLQAMQLDPTCPIMRALGVASLLAYLDGACDLESAVAQGKTDTRQYAKRQLTWARRHMISWKQVNLVDLKRNEALKVIFG